MLTHKENISGILRVFPQSKHENFVKNAPDGPHIRCLVVLDFQKGYFWGAVPSRADVARKAPLLTQQLFVLFIDFLGDCLLDFSSISCEVQTLMDDSFPHSKRTTRSFALQTFRQSSRNAEIANFDFTHRIYQNVVGF